MCSFYLIMQDYTTQHTILAKNTASYAKYQTTKSIYHTSALVCFGIHFQDFQWSSHFWLFWCSICPISFQVQERLTDPNNAELHYWLLTSLSSGTNLVHYIFFVKKLSSHILSLANLMCQAKVIRIYNCKQFISCPGLKLLGFSKCTFYWTL